VTDIPKLGQFLQQRDYLDRVYRSVAEVLQRHVAQPVFFVALVPKRWSVQYLAVNAPRDHASAARIRSMVTQYLAKFGTKNMGISIDELFDFCRTRLTDSPDDLKAGALSILVSTKEVRLGWSAQNSEGSWSLSRPDERPLRWVQDALEFAHRFGLDARAAQEAAHQRGYQFISPWEGAAAGIKVPKYLTRGGLIARDVEEVSYFLSEALSAVKGDLNTDTCPSELVHYFVPLAGLGQWRATACWISPPEGQAPSGRGQEIVTHVLRQALDEMFTQSVVSAITPHFTYVLSKPDGEERLSALCHAICSLWWADEVALFRGNEAVYWEARDQNGDFAPRVHHHLDLRIVAVGQLPSALCSPEPGVIVIDIASLSGLKRNVVGAALGCDRAVLRLRLFVQTLNDSNRILGIIQPQLSHIIGAVLGLHRLEVAERDKQRLQEATSAYATLAHELNKLFEKQFRDVPLLLRKSELSMREREAIMFAWEVLGSVVEVSYYLGKARITQQKRQRDNLFERFRGPIRSLQDRGALMSALLWVASRVYMLEAREGRRRIMSRRIPALEHARGLIDLQADEFARCYMLCAEPIRNYMAYGPPGEATWAVSVSQDGGLSVILTHGTNPDTYDLPASPTFDALATFLDLYPEWECRAVREWDMDGLTVKGVCWAVELGPALFCPEGKT